MSLARTLVLALSLLLCAASLQQQLLRKLESSVCRSSQQSSTKLTTQEIPERHHSCSTLL